MNQQRWWRRLARWTVVATALAAGVTAVEVPPVAAAGGATGPGDASAAARRAGTRVELLDRRAPGHREFANPDGTFTAELGATGVPTALGGVWSMINEAWPRQSYWAYDRAEGAKVGYEQDSIAPNNRYRSMFQFDLSTLRGKQVESVTFSAQLTHSYSCTPSTTDLYVVGAFGAATNWETHQATWTRRVSGASNESCRGARKDSEWGGAVLNESVAGALASGSVAVGLRAADENSYSNWKKFDGASAKLAIVYNSVPDAPTEPTVAGRACAALPATVYAGTTAPQLRARVSDADGGLLTARYSWGRLVDGAVQQPVVTAQTSASSGAIATATAPGLADNQTYAWNVTAGDGQIDGPASPWCAFTVDTKRPDKVPLISSADGVYPPGEDYHGGVGRSGQFRFASNGVSDDGVNDVAGYVYGLTDQPTTYVAAADLGGTAVGVLTPEWQGSNTVYVRSVDRAGNMSELAAYPFSVAPGTPPVARWKLDETTGTALADASGNNHPATLTGGQLGARSRVGGADTAVTLDGKAGHATAPGAGPVADKSFSVAAWVRLDSTAGFATAVAQDATMGSTFYLQYSKHDNAWAFSVIEKDGSDPGSLRAVSAEPPRPGVWTHLAGTYDLAGRQMRLYVNGQLASTVAVPPAWTRFASTGPVTIGRAKFNGAPADLWPGAIDDVQLWDRRIYPREVTRIADRSTLVGEWRFDEASGATATDSSGFGRAAAIGGGYSRTAGHAGSGTALDLAAGTGSAATSGPVLLTDQSFSVSAWVRLSDTGTYATAVGQDGRNVSGFFLQYFKASNRWGFSMSGTDDLNPTVYGRALATTAPATNTWTHLVGVHDVGRKEVRLYVDGQLAGTGTMPAMFPAGGPLTIGRARHAGQTVDLWRGALDDVRVYVGVLADVDIVNLSRS